MLILLVVGGMTYWQFTSKLKREEGDIQNQLEKTAFRIQNLTNSTTQYLHTVRHQIEYYSTHYNSSQKHIVSDYFQQGINPENELDYFHTDSLPPKLAKNFGNLTGLGIWKDLSSEQKHQISAILHAMTLFEEAPKLVPDFAWTYLESELTLSIYPRVLSNNVNISNNRSLKARKEGKYEHSILPTQNPKREVRWIKAYQDPAGKGGVISALIPLYYQDEYFGNAGIDVRLNTMGNIIKNSQRKYGKTFIINEYNQLIAHPDLITKKDTAIHLAKTAFPKALEEIKINELNSNEFYDINGYKFYYNIIPNTRWKQIYVVSTSVFYQYIFQEAVILLVLLIIFIINFILSVIYTRSHFIEPAYNLIKYIQAEQENQPFTDIPKKLPKIWQPWFKIVAKIFAENRASLQKISEHNENLENLVNQRTSELQAQNYKLEVQQQEISSQNEELQQQHEELISTRDQVAKNNELLERKNQRVSRNQDVLAKAYEKMKLAQDELKIQKNTLEEKNTQITSSIKYAQTIQDAILPAEERMRSNFVEHFVIYRPKDIVAGDFYWLSKIRNQTIFIVADCTGHGVPGAFMSLIGYSLLNEIINEKHILDPAQILDNLHFAVKKSLKQNKTNNRDGMDIGIVVIKKSEIDTRKITFCGAKIPLYYTNNQLFKEIKPTRKSIGGIQNNRKQFINHEITLASGEILYLGTDGYADQHNAKRDKFGQKKLLALFEKYYSEPMPKQLEIFENTLKNHQKDQKQRDDITLIGVKI